MRNLMPKYRKRFCNRLPVTENMLINPIVGRRHCSLIVCVIASMLTSYARFLLFRSSLDFVGKETVRQAPVELVWFKLINPLLFKILKISFGIKCLADTPTPNLTFLRRTQVVLLGNRMMAHAEDQQYFTQSVRALCHKRPCDFQSLKIYSALQRFRI